MFPRTLPLPPLCSIILASPLAAFTPCPDPLPAGTGMSLLGIRDRQQIPFDPSTDPSQFARPALSAGGSESGNPGHRPDEPSPFNSRTPIPELDSGAMDLGAWLHPGGLVVHWLGNAAGMRQVLRAERATPQAPFGPPAVVTLPGSSQLGLLDLWVSPDELELFTSGSPYGSVIEHVYTSRRPSTSSSWGSLVLVAELDSGLGDGGPVLSGDGFEIVFHSTRASTLDLWTATRTGRGQPWRTPIRLAALDQGGREAMPLFLEHDQRLVWTLSGICFPSLNFADRDHDGGWIFRGELPGAIHPTHHTLTACAYDTANDQLWLTAGDDPARVWIEKVTPTDHSLVASQSAVSAAHGGMVDFDLDAGAAFAAGRYYLMAGVSGPNPGFHWRESVVPLAFDWITEASILGANTGGLLGFAGYFDPAGRALARWDLAPGAISGPGLIGKDFRFAFVAFKNQEFVSNAVSVRLTP